jgi:uncharacterized membrane protein
MPTSCPDCAALMPDAAGFCPGCGRSMSAVERARGTVGVLPETMAGALAYFLLPAIVFLLVEPYKRNRFVRFHSVQGIVFFLLGVVVLLFSFVVVSPVFVVLILLVVGFALFVVWAVLIVKALQGEMLKLPLIGSFAASRSSVT